MPNQADIDRAKQGKDVWNAWAAENPGARVDFSSANLTGISFAGFQFPGKADFTGSAFFDRADFTGAAFHNEGPSYPEEPSDIRYESYRSLTRFARVNFIGQAIFTGVKFSPLTDFTGSTFLSLADFVGATFPDRVNFTGATFSDRADFTESRFASLADFARAKFASLADFTAAKFFDRADFTEGSFSREVYFEDSQFGVSFKGGPVDFSKRKFKGPTFFRDAKFFKVPLFHGASIHQFTIFGDIDNLFTDFRSQGAEHGYRTLKLAMSQQQARTEESAFAALELKARRHRLNSEAKNMKAEAKKKEAEAKKMKAEAKEMKAEARKMKLGLQRFLLRAESFVYVLWEKCSDSGRSFFLPLRLYLASLLAFTAIYVLLPLYKMIPQLYVLISIFKMHSYYALFLQNWWASLFYSFLKQFPFAAAFRGGSDSIAALEKKLFSLNEVCPSLVWVDVLNTLQSIIALVLIFLMGLGVRHKFRLR
ncbi:MAG: pentapeptide repeat-containing protein [Deltaproteobacteria bacterium]|nr:pentapeptide repeat-containing protein [Deltaproteobacteria bacterium]